jgi:hypothetical protein
MAAIPPDDVRRPNVTIRRVERVWGAPVGCRMLAAAKLWFFSTVPQRSRPPILP